MPTSPGPLLTTLDALWRRLRAEVPELPPIRPIISPGTRPLAHGPERWAQDDEGYVTGLVVSVDVLQEGPEATLLHVLHEAAHLLNWRRSIKDTTMRGAYHNQHFLSAAEEVGLIWPEGAQRATSRGYDAPVLADAAKDRFAPDLRALDAAIPLVLPHLEIPATTRVTRVDRLTLVCRCDPPRKVRVSRTVAAQGPIVCGVCREEFREE
ncbi:hypothetical protein [Streptomyces sennicomposti]